jgi:two-component system cell cycle sensor histidine kinase/response regulator CckA
MDQPPSFTPARKTVLLVDDDASVRAVISRELKHHYNTLVAGSGLEALQRSKDFAGEIRLLLTDFQLGGMNGIELATQITIKRPTTKVLLISGFTEGLLTLSQGWHFLAKPFAQMQLLTVIANLISPLPTMPLKRRAALGR